MRVPREADGDVEFLALTLWQSLDVIRQFAGDRLEQANVEPEARAVLADYDDFARHYEVAVVSHVPGTGDGGPRPSA